MAKGDVIELTDLNAPARSEPRQCYKEDSDGVVVIIDEASDVEPEKSVERQGKRAKTDHAAYGSPESNFRMIVSAAETSRLPASSVKVSQQQEGGGATPSTRPKNETAKDEEDKTNNEPKVIGNGSDRSTNTGTEHTPPVAKKQQPNELVEESGESGLPMIATKKNLVHIGEKRQLQDLNGREQGDGQETIPSPFLFASKQQPLVPAAAAGGSHRATPTVPIYFRSPTPGSGDTARLKRPRLGSDIAGLGFGASPYTAGARTPAYPGSVSRTQSGALPPPSSMRLPKQPSLRLPPRPATTKTPGSSKSSRLVSESPARGASGSIGPAASTPATIVHRKINNTAPCQRSWELKEKALSVPRSAADPPSWVKNAQICGQEVTAALGSIVSKHGGPDNTQGVVQRPQVQVSAWQAYARGMALDATADALRALSLGSKQQQQQQQQKVSSEGEGVSLFALASAVFAAHASHVQGNKPGVGSTPPGPETTFKDRIIRLMSCNGRSSRDQDAGRWMDAVQATLSLLLQQEEPLLAKAAAPGAPALGGDCKLGGVQKAVSADIGDIGFKIGRSRPAKTSSLKKEEFSAKLPRQQSGSSAMLIAAVDNGTESLNVTHTGAGNASKSRGGRPQVSHKEEELRPARQFVNLTALLESNLFKFSGKDPMLGKKLKAQKPLVEKFLARQSKRKKK